MPYVTQWIRTRQRLIAAQSGGGGGGATSDWGRDKDEDELSWAHRCAMTANRLCRPRKKQGYGR